MLYLHLSRFLNSTSDSVLAALASMGGTKPSYNLTCKMLCLRSPYFVPTTTSSGPGKTHSIWRAAQGFNYSTLLFHLFPLRILVCILCCEHKLLDFWIPLSHITCFNTKRPCHKLKYWLMLQRSGVSLPPELNSQITMMVSLVCTLYLSAIICSSCKVISVASLKWS